MKVLYFGTYDPNYSRNRVLLKGLRQNGVQVLECRVKPGLGWQVRLLVKYLKMRPKFDVMIVGFPGQEVMMLARILTGRPIIFDAFTSHYGGYVLDRKKVSPSSWRARWYAFLDRVSCRLADAVLLDTNAHIDFFVRMFKLPRQKFHRIFVGTDSSIFYARPVETEGKDFLVHFHGHFIPLQGIEYIVRAAKLLENENIRFNIIGKGQEYKDVRMLGDKLGVKNINWIPEVPYEVLPGYIAQADVCLGIFGVSPKTPLVIPNKIFEAIAMAKPVITADTPAARELFKNEKNCILVPVADPQALADAVKRLKNNPDRRHDIGQSGYKMFNIMATPEHLGREVQEIATSLLYGK